jgi:hypothetical protein
MTAEQLKVVEQEAKKPLIIAPIAIPMVEFIYPKCIPHLQRVCDKAPNEITVDTIKRNLLSGKQMLIAILDGEEVVACNVVEKVTFDTGWNVLYIPITGGDRMDEWEDRFLQLAHAIARDLGCDELRGLACRKGWLRNLEPRGWYRLHDVIGCKVEEAQP